MIRNNRNGNRQRIPQNTSWIWALVAIAAIGIVWAWTTDWDRDDWETAAELSYDPMVSGEAESTDVNFGELNVNEDGDFGVNSNDRDVGDVNEPLQNVDLEPVEPIMVTQETEISNNPQEYLDKEVVMTGTIESVQSPMLFTIKVSGPGEGEGVQVIHENSDIFEEGANVRVTGKFLQSNAEEIKSMAQKDVVNLKQYVVNGQKIDALGE